MPYITVKIPVEFAVKHIDPILKKASSGYTSRADVVKDILRENTKREEEKKKKESQTKMESQE